MLCTLNPDHVPIELLGEVLVANHLCTPYTYRSLSGLLSRVEGEEGYRHQWGDGKRHMRSPQSLFSGRQLRTVEEDRQATGFKTFVKTEYLLKSYT